MDHEIWKKLLKIDLKNTLFSLNGKEANTKKYNYNILLNKIFLSITISSKQKQKQTELKAHKAYKSRCRY